MTAQSAATTTQARFEAQSTTGAKSARQNYQSNAPQQPTFKPEINKKSTKLAPQKAPIFSNERYQKEIEDRNQKLEQKRLKRQLELEEKELREQEELARRNVHKTG